MNEASISDDSKNRSKYILFIRACFRCYPESIAYYERLIDHLDETGPPQSSLQTVEHFEIAALPATPTYPRNFPIKVTDWTGAQHLPKIAVLNGFPSPQCIAYLGARFDIRPEFFLANLALNGKRGPQAGYYELPTLPSLRENLVRVHLIGPLKSLVDNARISLIARRRSDIEKACSKYEKSIAHDKRFGATRYRRVNLHDSQICSVEQAVSLTIAQEDGKWYAIFLTDQGRNFTVQEGLPWSKQSLNGRPMGYIALVPYNLPVERGDESNSTDGTSANVQIDMDQFHPLKRIALNDEVDFELLKSDPFFLCASLLRTSLLSWAQLLNVLKEVIKGSQNTLELSNEELRYDLDQLRYHIGIVHRTKEQVSEILELVKQGGCTAWPKASSDKQQERKESIQRQLECDCQNVMSRCSFMIADYESATAILVGFAQLKASERQMSQAKEVHSLTKLATLFIPLSFTSSIYGMNITEWQPTLTIWWFMGTGATLLSCTFLYLYRHRWINLFHNLWERIPGRSTSRSKRII